MSIAPYPHRYRHGPYLYGPYYDVGPAWAYADPYSLSRDLKRLNKPKYRLRTASGGKFFIYREDVGEWQGPYASIDEAIGA